MTDSGLMVRLSGGLLSVATACARVVFRSVGERVSLAGVGIVRYIYNKVRLRLCSGWSLPHGIFPKCDAKI